LALTGIPPFNPTTVRFNASPINMSGTAGSRRFNNRNPISKA
jgi:hypothetical protein